MSADVRRTIACVKRFVAILAGALALVATPAFTAKAAPRTRVDGICKGCLASVPATSDGASKPAPLLVTLHGDWGVMAPELHAGWERFAAPREVALLSLTCPSELGCKRSWWQWNGSPQWITEQIDRLAARYAIDRERLWVAGWSGGATYIGMRTQEFERTFAALVLHGGGIWPLRPECAPEQVPATFLIGDQNPLHAHVLKLREHYQQCGNEVVTMLLRGADHDGEWSALDKRGGEILDWLATKRHVTVAVASALPAAPVSPAPTTAAPSTAAPPEMRPLPPRAGCGCDTTALSSNEGWRSVAVAAAVAAALRKARRVLPLNGRSTRRP